MLYVYTDVYRCMGTHPNIYTNADIHKQVHTPPGPAKEEAAIKPPKGVEEQMATEQYP